MVRPSGRLRGAVGPYIFQLFFGCSQDRLDFGGDALFLQYLPYFGKLLKNLLSSTP